uniref:Putative secreted protein n=1 Tax=Anopheles darlingi TaxID=43151 RepID=A0A2M4D921_ANODA
MLMFALVAIYYLLFVFKTGKPYRVQINRCVLSNLLLNLTLKSANFTLEEKMVHPESMETRSILRNGFII